MCTSISRSPHSPPPLACMNTASIRDIRGASETVVACPRPWHVTTACLSTVPCNDGMPSTVPCNDGMPSAVPCNDGMPLRLWMECNDGILGPRAQESGALTSVPAASQPASLGLLLGPLGRRLCRRRRRLDRPDVGRLDGMDTWVRVRVRVRVRARVGVSSIGRMSAGLMAWIPGLGSGSGSGLGLGLGSARSAGCRLA